MNKLQRKQLDNKHTHKHFDGWTHFTGEPRVNQTQHKDVSYRTKLQQRDELKLEKEGWK
jgi:hypothetical protein